ncbi:MAG TPA: tetratricopeptide repeat protein [Terriglobales bacterium]|nr:tetratricopeptide repeat protein [Terriglobales bacterium]
MPAPARNAVTAQKNDGLFASPEKRNVVLCLLLIVLTLALYNPVNQHPFVNYDDPGYVTDNSHVRDGLSWNTITWAFTATEQANWHPLTWISHAFDYQLFHSNPAGHHFDSLLIHALSAVVLFLILVNGTGRVGASFFVAALFALHPINVESVAWIAERKNVLSTLLFFLAIGAYGWYAAKPCWQRYMAIFVLFALGLMAKPMVITLPCVLLLLDYWPLGRIGKTSTGKLIVEKLPLFALSAGSALMTMSAQQAGGAMRSTVQFSLGTRLANAIVAYATYLWKMIWPLRLAPMYPHPGESLAGWQIGVALLVLLSITGLVILRRDRRYLAMGWCWFLGTLVPVIGLVQVGDQASADRYAYIPLVGMFVMIAFGVADLADAKKFSFVSRLIAAACILTALSFLTYRQLGYWSSSYDLWAHTLAITQNNFVAEDNMGGALLLLGKPDEAHEHFVAAARINPRDPMSHSNLGAYLQEHNQLREAVQEYESTIQMTSDPALLASTYANLGAAYRDLGDDAKARESYDQALRLNPNQFNAYLGLGRLLERQGKLDEAIANYSRSIEIRPTESGFLRVGHALEMKGRRHEAVSAYQQALQLNPDSTEAQQALKASSQ